jgi:DNA-binding PadR family transcriptional regulator
MTSGGENMEQDRKDEVLENLILELRRGTVVISVLSQLMKPEYGYNLVTNLSAKGFAVDPGTLYPLLRRLEKQGLLESSWDTAEARPRKYYVVSGYGKEIFIRLSEEWQKLAGEIECFIDRGDGHNETTH